MTLFLQCVKAEAEIGKHKSGGPNLLSIRCGLRRNWPGITAEITLHHAWRLTHSRIARCSCRPQSPALWRRKGQSKLQLKFQSYGAPLKTYCTRNLKTDLRCFGLYDKFMGQTPKPTLKAFLVCFVILQQIDMWVCMRTHTHTPGWVSQQSSV